MAESIPKKSVADTLRENNLGTPAESIDRVFQSTSVGPLSNAIGSTFYGINHRQTPSAIPINKDSFGLAFFTRPRLNLTSNNLRASRLMRPLLNTESRSLQRIIRCLLDVELAKKGISSPYIDNQQAFIPMLTNNLLSMSGWRDLVAPTMTSQEGIYKESFTMVDGVTEDYSTYDITANFRNLPGDPITSFFMYWLHYMSLVYRGIMVPYPDMIIQNEIDYNTRIYRLILDPSKTQVQKIAACGAAFPVSAPLGAAFNFESDRPLNEAGDQITINFQAMGCLYQDDILIHEFNQTVAMFNDTMAARNFQTVETRVGTEIKYESTNPYYKKVPMEALGIFNNRGYPRINPNSYELEWWVSQEDYRMLLPALQSN